MILFPLFLVGIALIVWLFYKTARYRPRPLMTGLELPIPALLLALPIFFEDASCVSCDGPGSVVVGSSPETFRDKGLFAWCPRQCVNVPKRITEEYHLFLNVYIAFEFEINDPVEATRKARARLPEKKRRGSSRAKTWLSL